MAANITDLWDAGCATFPGCRWRTLRRISISGGADLSALRTMAVNAAYADIGNGDFVGSSSTPMSRRPEQDAKSGPIAPALHLYLYHCVVEKLAFSLTTMKHEVALQPDTRIIIRDNVYNVSSSKLRSLSVPLSNLLDTCTQGTVKLSGTESAQAFLHFLQSAHGTFVPQDEVTSSVLTDLARLLQRYDIQPNTPPYDLVQFCFARRTLRPARLTPLDLSRMLSVARILGSTYMKQLLLQIFERDNSHQGIEPHGSDVQTTTLLANVILRRNDLCVEVGNLLVRSAKDVSAVASHCEDLNFLKAIWDNAILILSHRPSPSSMVRLLWRFEVPQGWELFVPREEALRIIKAAIKEVERWLTSELDAWDYETQTLHDDCDSMGFEQLELSPEVETSAPLESPLGSEFRGFDDDGVALSEHETDKLSPERAQTM